MNSKMGLDTNVLLGHSDWQPHMHRARNPGLPHRPLDGSRPQVFQVHRVRRKPRDLERQLQAGRAGRLWIVRLQARELEAGVESVLGKEEVVRFFFDTCM